MKHYLLFGIVSALLVVQGAPAWSDSPDAFQFFAEEAMVQGISKHAESLKETPMSTYVVTREEMQRWGVRDIDDIFGRVPGYSFYSTDFYGQYGPIVRGLQSVWRSGFSVELMPIVDFGHLSSLSPNMFKTIEVARGPAGGLTWGSSAEAGLLNLNLRDDLNGGEVDADVGNYGRQSVDVMYGKPFQKKGDGFFVGYHEISQDAQDTHSIYGTPSQNQLWRSDGINPSYSAIGKFQSGAIKVLALSEHDDHVAPTAWFGSPTPQAFQQAFQQAEGQDLHDELDTLAYRAEIHAPIENDNYSLYLYHDYYKKQWYTQGVALVPRANGRSDSTRRWLSWTRESNSTPEAIFGEKIQSTRRPSPQVSRNSTVSIGTTPA